jgi:hypothetical protein
MEVVNELINKFMYKNMYTNGSLLGSSLHTASILALKMEVVFSSETLVCSQMLHGTTTNQTTTYCHYYHYQFWLEFSQ